MATTWIEWWGYNRFPGNRYFATHSRLATKVEYQ